MLRLGVSVMLRLGLRLWLGLRLGLSFTFSSFLPSILHSCALLLRHRWCMNKFSNLKIHKHICSHSQSHCLKTNPHFLPCRSCSNSISHLRFLQTMHVSWFKKYKQSKRKRKYVHKQTKMESLRNVAYSKKK